MEMLRFIVITFSFLTCFGYKISEYDTEVDYSDSRKPENGQNVSRIIGGHPADIKDYPYQCSFIGNGQYFCGCFIIDQWYILTAAHCAGANASNIALRVGSTFRRNGTLVPVANVTAHPQYDDPPFDKDVAVLKLAEPLVFSDTVQPIALPEAGRPVLPGSNVTIAGWGRTRQGASTIPERLMAVDTKAVDQRLCRLSYMGTLTDNMFCAGRFLLGGEGVCQGDSGGAAIQGGKAIGIVSFGRICGQPLAPSVFCNIASPPMRAFIKEHTGL